MSSSDEAEPPGIGPRMAERIPARSAAARVRDLQDLRAIMAANGYVVPALRTRACTLFFLNGARVGVDEYWLPFAEREQVAYRQIVGSVTAKEASEELQEGLRRFAARAENEERREQILKTQRHLLTHMGDKLWLVQVLGHVWPESRLFRKSRATAGMRAAAEEQLVNNRDGLFNDVEELTGARLHKRNTLGSRLAPRTDPVARMQRQRARLEERIAAA